MRRILLLLLGFGGGAVMAVILIQNTVHALVPQGEPLSWPYSVEQTPLSILGVLSYDGAYPEDGSGDPVSGVAAIVLENTGHKTLRNGAVRLLQGDQILVFSFTMLPPDARILVVEKSRLPYADTPITACWGWSLDCSSEKQVLVQEYGRTGLTVTNLTDQPLGKALVRFKLYDPTLSLYIGGYTYCLEVEDLRPGVPRMVPVYRYVTGTCRVVE